MNPNPQLQALLDADPRFQKALTLMRSGGHGPEQATDNVLNQVAAQIASEHGMTFDPKQTRIDTSSGQIDQQSWIAQHGGQLAAGALGAFAAPAILGGMGLGAAAGAGAGGASGAAGGMSIPSIIGGIGSVAGGIASGRASGRAAEGNANNQYDTNRINYANYNLGAPAKRAHNSVQGDILAGVQPMTVNGPITGTHGQIPQISGGISPALLSENSRNLGKEMSRSALLDQMNGPMNPTAQPQSSGVDTALNAAGYAGLASDTWNAFHPPKPKTQIPEIPTPWTVDRLNSMRAY